MSKAVITREMVRQANQALMDKELQDISITFIPKYKLPKFIYNVEETKRAWSDFLKARNPASSKV